jgi:hypothetical protein
MLYGAFRGVELSANITPRELCMKSIFLLALVLLVGCASKQPVMNSNFNTVKLNKTGALLTIDLDTAGKIKRGQSCKLLIRHNQETYQMPLKEGAFNYALPLGAGMANLQELNCGAFYYYKIDDPRSTFKIENGKLSYLGRDDLGAKYQISRTT